METGIDLARAFHREVVAPVIAAGLPGLRYAAARLGSGSDVLGLDDAMSRDHDWGCRLTVLVDEVDRAVLPSLENLLERELPQTFRGFAVRFPVTWSQRVSHQVQAATVGGFASSRLGVDPLVGLSVLDWLCLNGQSVLEVTAGPVFVDHTTELAVVRERLRWYLPDVERYVLAAAWQRVAQWLPIHGRTAERGQKLQSRMLAASLADDLVRIGLLLHRRWPPYGKWREAMFRSVPGAAAVAASLSTALTADGWRDREAGLVEAIEGLLGMQRGRGLATPRVGVTPFWDRPYRGVDPEVPQALLAEIGHPQVRKLPPGIGSVEQWVDNVDVLTDARRRFALVNAYRAWLAE